MNLKCYISRRKKIQCLLFYNEQNITKVDANGGSNIASMFWYSLVLIKLDLLKRLAENK